MYNYAPSPEEQTAFVPVGCMHMAHYWSVAAKYAS